MASERFKQLPKPIRLEDTVESKDVRPVPDPDCGRNPDTDFLIRYGMFF